MRSYPLPPPCSEITISQEDGTILKKWTSPSLEDAWGQMRFYSKPLSAHQKFILYHNAMMNDASFMEHMSQAALV